MDDEPEVWLVEAHAEGDGSDQGLDIVAEELLFGLDALVGLQVGVVGAGHNALPLEPFGGAPRILHREGVNDAAAGQLREEVRQPRQPVGLIVQRDIEELERAADQRATQDVEACYLRLNVFHDAVVGGGRRAEDRHPGRQQAQDAHDAPVIRAEIMPPIRNAVRLIHHKHPDAALNQRQQLLQEGRVAQPLRRNHQHVHAVGLQVSLDLRPVLQVLAVDGRGADAQLLGGEDLVAHEREQRADEQGRPGACVAQNPGRQEINHALAPPCALDHQQPPTLVGRQVNSLPLPVAKLRTRTEHLPQQSQCGLLLHPACELAARRAAPKAKYSVEKSDYI